MYQKLHCLTKMFHKKKHFNLPNGILANDGMKKKAGDSKHTAIEY